MRSRRVLGLLAGGAALALPNFAFAQWDSPLSFLSGEWTVTARANVVGAPKYPGSDELSWFGYPSFKVRRAGAADTFGAPDDAISLALIRHGGLRIGPSFRYIGSRSPSDDIELIGLAKVPWTLEAGAFVEYWPTDFLRARVDVRHGFHGHEGVVADVAADGFMRFAQWTFSAGPRLRLASSHYQQAYFSVTPAESAASGLPAYAAGSGVNAVGLAGSASYKFSPQWELTGYARYERLLGDAADSPITRLTGSPNQWTVGAILGYSFDVRIP
jgi:outer membrane scaffolding protein for murein synthesis (MipA/OmpV family)